MGCKSIGEVTEEELERLDILEETLSYPPRFRIQFISNAVVESSLEVTVRFNQIDPPVTSTITLEGSLTSLNLSPYSSAATVKATDLESFSRGILHII